MTRELFHSHDKQRCLPACLAATLAPLRAAWPAGEPLLEELDAVCCCCGGGDDDDVPGRSSSGGGQVERHPRGWFKIRRPPPRMTSARDAGSRLRRGPREEGWVGVGVGGGGVENKRQQKKCADLRAGSRAGHPRRAFASILIFIQSASPRAERWVVFRRKGECGGESGGASDVSSGPTAEAATILLRGCVIAET